MIEILTSFDPILLGGIGLIVFTLFVGVISIRSGNRSKYFRLKRKRVEAGWKWIFASLGSMLIFVGVFFFIPDLVSMPAVKTNVVATPTVGTQNTLIPIKTITSPATKAITLSPTVLASASPMPSETIAMTSSPSAPPTSTMRPTLTPSLTNTLAPTFTPAYTLTVEPTWTMQVVTSTVTNTRAPTATEPAP